MPHDGHDHDDHSELSPIALRVKALESLLVEKGYVDPAALDVLIDTYETWSEWAETLGAEIKSHDAPYYEQWLAALEKIVEAKGLMSQVERLNRVDAWDRAAHATPHGQPIELSRS